VINASWFSIGSTSASTPGRSLRLITLNPAANKWEATGKDIATNPKHLKFTLLDFAAQSRSLPDLDAAVGYTEYYLAAKVPISQQIFAPPAPEFAGQLTIGSQWADSDNIKKLVETFKDAAVAHFLATDPGVKNILLPV
jgi:ABC-type metal ion transport system substrate-binding protein